MDYIYNIKVLLDKSEVNEFKDTIVNKMDTDIFINKKLNIYGFPDLDLSIAYYDNRLIISIFSGTNYLKEEEFKGISSMEEIFNIFRIDFEYQGKSFSLYLKLEKECTGSTNELIKKNLEELDLLRIKATSNDLCDLIYYVNFLDLNSHLNVLYSSYLIISHYILTADEIKSFVLIGIFKKKLEKIGIYIEEIDFEKEILNNLNFLINKNVLNVRESAFTLINLLAYNDSEIVKKTIKDVIQGEMRIYNAMANIIKTNPYIHLL